MGNEQTGENGKQGNTENQEASNNSSTNAGAGNGEGENTSLLGGGGNKGTEGEGSGSEGNEGEEKSGETESREGAPESYDEFNLPDELKDSIPEEGLTEFKELAKGLDLSQEHAQSLMDFHFKKLGESFEVSQEANADAVKAHRAELIKTARADPEIGGGKFDDCLAGAQEAVRTHGSDELVNLLNESGWGDHPEMIRAWHNVYQATKEDNSEEDTSGEGGGEKTLAQRAYPNLPSAKGDNRRI